MAVNEIVACFEWGALVALLPRQGPDGSSSSLPRTLQLWTALVALVVFSTVHVAEFPDVEGDRERGRQTMTRVCREAVSRGLLAVAAPLWSVAALLFWNIAPGAYCLPPLLIAGCMAGMTVLARGEHDHYGSDERVWKLWCMWVVTLFVLPLVGLAWSLEQQVARCAEDRRGCLCIC
ncbi:geranylgeranylglycerol-phosphate geranylgeranyltransferase [Microdochium nivale]|nr:geranylgeranylglycerol-phosphate geranylgeranyltransferase [Microdochium nivale]